MGWLDNDYSGGDDPSWTQDNNSFDNGSMSSALNDNSNNNWWGSSDQNPSWVGQTDQVSTYANGPSWMDQIGGALQQPMWNGNKAPTMGEGLFGLAKMFMGNRANSGRVDALRSAQGQLQGAMNPHTRGYQDQLWEMMQNPGSNMMTPDRHQALQNGVDTATRLAAAQGRTANIPLMGMRAQAQMGEQFRQNDIGNLLKLQSGNDNLASASANITGRIGDLEAQNMMSILQQLGLFGTRAGLLPDRSGSQMSNDSVLQAMAIIQALNNSGNRRVG